MTAVSALTAIYAVSKYGFEKAIGTSILSSGIISIVIQTDAAYILISDIILLTAVHLLFRWDTIIWKSSDSHIFLKDRYGRYQKVNEGLGLEYNLPRKEWEGKDDYQIFDSETAEAYKEFDRQVRDAGKPISKVFRDSFRGNKTRVMVTKEPLYNSSGDFEGVLGISKDMSDVLDYLDLLTSSNTLLSMILDHSVDPIFFKDRDHIYRMVNRAFVGYHGMSPEEISGKSDYDLYDEKTAKLYRDADKLVMETRERYAYESKAVVDGRIAYTQIIKSPVYDDKGEIIGVVGIAHDVTQIKAAEQQMIQAEKIDLLQTMAGGITHDLNNILSGVLGYVSLTKEVFSDDELIKYLDLIERSTSKASSLITKLKMFTQNTPYEVKPVDLNAIITETMPLIRSGVAKGVTIKVELTEELPYVDGDATEISQLVLNLVINAVEAVDKKKGEVHISTYTEEVVSTDNFLVRSKRAVPGNYVVLEVEDNGFGIQEDNLMEIFEPYYTTKDEFEKKGTGLGLTVVHGIVNSHRGLIDIKLPKRGTVFRIFIPEGRSQEVTESIENLSLERYKGLKITIADDDKDVGVVLSEITKKMGFRTSVCRSGMEALAEIRKGDTALLILDHLMPDMHGLTVMKKLREFSDIPVIISSGLVDVKSMEKYRELGITQLLNKPYTYRTLGRAIHEALSS